MQLVTPVSNILVLVIALLCVDNADLYEFNKEGDSAGDAVVKAQLLLNAQYELLKINSRELKLSKYYQVL